MISFVEVFGVALKSLRINKTRSLLTALGIIIGVAAVIAAFAVGAGANKSIEKQISSLGSNFMVVFTDFGASSGGGPVRYLTDKDAVAIESEVSGVAAVAPIINTSAQVVYGNLNWNTSVTGSTGGFSAVRDWGIAQGRGLLPSDVQDAEKIAVIGQTVADKLFEKEDPIGKVIRIKRMPFTVVGVLEVKGQSFNGQDQDDVILVPLTTAQRSLVRYANSPGRLSYIMVKGISLAALNYVEVQIGDLLKERHRIKEGQPNDFGIRNISQVLEARRQTTKIMSLLLGAIAVISLVVGGIGIMNIMLVSVTERTREIGIRMAIGAKARDIRLQFLIEAVVLSLIGGIIGILVGVAAGYGLGSVTQAPPVFSVASIVVAFGFSALVGVIFGFYPAWKASLLNPIDALKYE